MAEPGWYAHETDPDLLRYWDGARWTGHLAPAPGGGVAGEQAHATGGGDCFFISYRRQDTRWPAKLIRDRLTQAFGETRVFFDLASIPAGYDFTDIIDDYLERTRVMLAVIGPGWLDARDSNGNRRLDNPADLVRIELGRALERRIRTIPLLVDGAEMPAANLLPADLAPLARRHAIGLDANNPDGDLDRLMRELESTPQPQPQPAPQPQPQPAPQPPPRELLASRIVAFFLDLLLTTALAYGIGASLYLIKCPEGSEVCKRVGDNGGAVGLAWVAGTASILLLLLLYWALPVSRTGSTLFMRAFGLRVVRSDGEGIGFWRALVRAMLLVIPTLAYGLGILYLATMREGRSAVDRWTETVVTARRQLSTART